MDLPEYHDLIWEIIMHWSVQSISITSARLFRLPEHLCNNRYQYFGNKYHFLLGYQDLLGREEMRERTHLALEWVLYCGHFPLRNADTLGVEERVALCALQLGDPGHAGTEGRAGSEGGEVWRWRLLRWRPRCRHSWRPRFGHRSAGSDWRLSAARGYWAYRHSWKYFKY